MQRYVIIVAGGVGSRMKSDRPKQFLDLNGTPILVHTLRRFLQYDATLHLILVVHKDYATHLASMLEKFDLLQANITITLGGETRFDSVKNGLNTISSKEGIVGIHDAARPLVSIETIRTCFETALSEGNAIPCIPVNESMRKINNALNEAVDRNAYRIIQTPQCFRLSEIVPAFETAYSSTFTDDATVLEAAGGKIKLVTGNVENIKITSPQDLILAQALIAHVK